MGLLSFVKSIGEKLFHSEEDAPEKITNYIEKDNPGVSNLKVEVKDGVATLSGEAESAEAREKAVLMAGNIEGIEEVKFDNLNAPASEVKVEYYEIVAGDTLYGIAKKFYGDGNMYMKIFEANREVIKDPDKIYVGQKIRIPLD